MVTTVTTTVIFSIKGLKYGQHVFEVKAIDSDGNEDPDPDKVSFAVDTSGQLPEVKILNTSQRTFEPESPIKTPDYTFLIQGSDKETNRRPVEAQRRPGVDRGHH